MKITIEKDFFLEAIKTVQRASVGNAGIFVQNGILIKAVNDRITLTGGDTNLCIETTIGAEVFEPGRIVVNSRIFGDIIRSFPNAPVHINTVESKFIQISCEKNTANLIYIGEEAFPKLPAVNEDVVFSIPQGLLKEMIRGSIFASSQDNIRPIYTGVLFDFSTDKLYVVAVDGYRAAILHSPMDIDINKKVVIPAKTLNEIEKLLEWNDSEVKIAFTANQIMFSIGQAKIISILLEGDFGKYESFIPKESNLSITIDRKALMNCLEAVSIISREGKQSPVILDIQENIMIISSTSEFGESKGELNITSYGTPMLIKFNSKYLIDAVSALEAEQITIEFTSSNSVCVIKNYGSDRHVHIVSPLRI